MRSMRLVAKPEKVSVYGNGRRLLAEMFRKEGKYFCRCAFDRSGNALLFEYGTAAECLAATSRYLEGILGESFPLEAFSGL